MKTNPKKVGLYIYESIFFIIYISDLKILKLEPYNLNWKKGEIILGIGVWFLVPLKKTIGPLNLVPCLRR